MISFGMEAQRGPRRLVVTDGTVRKEKLGLRDTRKFDGIGENSSRIPCVVRVPIHVPIEIGGTFVIWALPHENTPSEAR
jgi:hypothetical protein